MTRIIPTIALDHDAEGRHRLTISPPNGCPFQCIIDRPVDGRFAATIGAEVWDYSIRWNYKWSLETFCKTIVRRLQKARIVADTHYRLIGFGTE